MKRLRIYFNHFFSIPKFTFMLIVNMIVLTVLMYPIPQIIIALNIVLGTLLFFIFDMHSHKERISERMLEDGKKDSK